MTSQKCRHNKALSKSTAKIIHKIQHNFKQNLQFFWFGITTLWDWVTLGTHA
jgi:hypothetical protein